MRRDDSNPRRRRAACAVAVWLGVAVVSGCGTYTKQDFSASANAICAGAVRSTRAVSPPDETTGSPAQQTRALGRYFGRLVPIVRSEAKQIARLQRPQQSTRERLALRRYLAALRASVSNFEGVAAAAANGNARALVHAEDQLSANPVAARATAYGLSSCGAPGATYARPS